MRKYLGLKRYQVGIIITLIAAFAIVGFNTVKENVKEEIAHEQLLQERREKIDSLRIIELQNTEEDGTNKK